MNDIMTMLETEQNSVVLSGMEAFLSPIACRQDASLLDLSCVPKARSEQLLIKRGTAKKLPEARFKNQDLGFKIPDHLRPD